METYAKLSSKLITSSLWATETPEAKVLWITLLAMKDRSGNVSGTVPGLARMAGISIEDTEAALQRFQEPDPYSRTKENEGKRIVPTEDGWHLLNHEKYRDAGGTSAERVRRHRKRKQSTEPDGSVTPCNVTSVTCNASNVTETHTDTDTDTDNSLSHSRSKKFAKAWGRWEEHRRQKLAPLGAIEADSQQMELSRCFPDEADQIAAVEFSIARGAKNLITNGDHKRAPPKTSGGNQGQTAFERVGL